MRYAFIAALVAVAVLAGCAARPSLKIKYASADGTFPTQQQKKIAEQTWTGRIDPLAPASELVSPPDEEGNAWTDYVELFETYRRDSMTYASDTIPPESKTLDILVRASNKKKCIPSRRPPEGAREPASQILILRAYAEGLVARAAAKRENNDFPGSLADCEAVLKAGIHFAGCYDRFSSPYFAATGLVERGLKALDEHYSAAGQNAKAAAVQAAAETAGLARKKIIDKILLASNMQDYDNLAAQVKIARNDEDPKFRFFAVCALGVLRFWAHEIAKTPDGPVENRLENSSFAAAADEALRYVRDNDPDRDIRALTRQILEETTRENIMNTELYFLGKVLEKTLGPESPSIRKGDMVPEPMDSDRVIEPR